MGRFHATKSKVEAYNVNPTIAFKVNDAFSIGVGANWQHLKADLGSDVAYGGVAYYGAPAGAHGTGPAAGRRGRDAQRYARPAARDLSGVATETPALISGDSNAWGWNVGALVKLGEQAHVGVSYRSKVTHDVKGTVDVHGRADLQPARRPGPDRDDAERPVRERPRHDDDRPARHALGRRGLGERQGRGAGRLDVHGLGLDPVAGHQARGRDGELQQRRAQVPEHLARRPRRQLSS